jgi:hypothetical protein
MGLDLTIVRTTLESVTVAVQTNLNEFADWWNSLSSAYRAAGCFVASLLLMLEATKSTDRDRKFFLYGVLSLVLLISAALLFVNRRGG